MTRFYTPDITGSFWRALRIAFGIGIATGMALSAPAIISHAMQWGIG